MMQQTFSIDDCTTIDQFLNKFNIGDTTVTIEGETDNVVTTEGGTFTTQEVADKIYDLFLALTDEIYEKNKEKIKEKADLLKGKIFIPLKKNITSELSKTKEYQEKHKGRGLEVDHEWTGKHACLAHVFALNLLYNPPKKLPLKECMTPQDFLYRFDTEDLKVDIDEVWGSDTVQSEVYSGKNENISVAITDSFTSDELTDTIQKLFGKMDFSTYKKHQEAAKEMAGKLQKNVFFPLLDIVTKRPTETSVYQLRNISRSQEADENDPLTKGYRCLGHSSVLQILRRPGVSLALEECKTPEDFLYRFYLDNLSVKVVENSDLVEDPHFYKKHHFTTDELAEKITTLFIKMDKSTYETHEKRAKEVADLLEKKIFEPLKNYVLENLKDTQIYRAKNSNYKRGIALAEDKFTEGHHWLAHHRVLSLLRNKPALEKEEWETI